MNVIPSHVTVPAVHCCLLCYSTLVVYEYDNINQWVMNCIDQSIFISNYVPSGIFKLQSHLSSSDCKPGVCAVHKFRLYGMPKAHTHMYM